MGLIDNLSQSQIPEIFRRLRALENGAPMNSAAIGRGGIEVYDGGVINITNGGLSVTGTATITGTLQADGTIKFTGTLTQSGPSTFTGDTKLNGPTHINGATDITGNVTSTGTFTNNGPTNLNGATRTTGTLSVEGVTTLKNDLNVTAGGKIKAGVTQVNPDGTITLGPGLTLTPDNGSGTAAIKAGASQIQLTPSNPTYWAQFTGGAYFQGRVSAMDLRLDSLQTTTEKPNLYIGADGIVKRSTAA